MFSLRWPQQSLSGIYEFLKSVKTLLRSQNAVCLITAPLKKMSENLKQLVLKSCDLVILTRQQEDPHQTKIVIYKAPKSLNIEESSSYTVLQSQGTTVIESI
jgi:archaellum biogenesis ATPase FlaH